MLFINKFMNFVVFLQQKIYVILHKTLLLLNKHKLYE